MRDPIPSTALLAAFDATAPVFVETTAQADIWRVESPHGLAALKHYRAGHMGNEAAGFALLRQLSGRVSAKVYGVQADAALTEWLGGESLGDQVRAGRDGGATLVLAQVAQELQRETPDLALDRVETWFEALFALDVSGAAPQSRSDMATAQAVARHVLATQGPQRALHGDLHHDNIRRTARGWCAFDAKGVIAEPAYELANALRNPNGAEAVIRDPARLEHRLSIWAPALGCSEARLLNWGIAKLGLSIAWRAKGALGGTLGGTLADDADLDVLQMFLAIAGERGGLSGI